MSKWSYKKKNPAVRSFCGTIWEKGYKWHLIGHAPFYIDKSGEERITVQPHTQEHIELWRELSSDSQRRLLLRIEAAVVRKVVEEALENDIISLGDWYFSQFTALGSTPKALKLEEKHILRPMDISLYPRKGKAEGYTNV